MILQNWSLSDLFKKLDPNGHENALYMGADPSYGWLAKWVVGCMLVVVLKMKN